MEFIEEEKWIKLSDFADEKGVSTRAIQKHIQNHREELEGDGHVRRHGKNGTFLDEFAVQYIESLMITKPTVISDAALLREADELKRQLEASEREKEELKRTAQRKVEELERRVQLMQEYQDKYNEEHKETLRLTERAESLVERAVGAETKLTAAGIREQELNERVKRTESELIRSTETTENLRGKYEETLIRAVAAENRLEAEKQHNQALSGQLDDIREQVSELSGKITMLTSRSLWQRITRKGE